MKKQIKNKINIFNTWLCSFLQKYLLNKSFVSKNIIHSSYGRLMRLHQPMGVQLLITPVLWVLVVVSSNVLQFFCYVIIFTVGAISMRGAGVIINDLIDRDFDNKVERTKSRPITSGELSIKQAIKFLVVLLCISLIILLFLPITSILIGVVTVIATLIYPLLKRYTYFPQVFLGFTFNMGVFIAWFAINTDKSLLVAILIYIASVLWTIAYDTIYAHQDKDFDEKIGIKSMALFFGEKSRVVIRYLYNISIIFLALAALNANMNIVFYLILGLIYFIINNQINNINFDSKESCGKAFKDNFVYGMMILIAFIFGNI
ncbi:MAG: 4-hydroxybenzoate polyprenyltransferase [Candidatus Midichloriaceae bacterium]|jgi:4-hydroxybenzoate polyprenyltransferase